MEPLEIEVKFYLTNIDSIRNLILDQGARFISRSFETNIRFEDQSNSLIQKRCLLRLRKDNRTTLTFKSSPEKKSSEFKIFKELEVEISDFDMMRRILEALGFHKEQVYEKRRETYQINNATICIDSMPYGNFIEIEGTENIIRELAQALQLKWDHRILLSYLAMFETIKRHLELPFTDLTFNNFASVDVNITRYLDRFEAGA